MAALLNLNNYIDQSSFFKDLVNDEIFTVSSEKTRMIEFQSVRNDIFFNFQWGPLSQDVYNSLVANSFDLEKYNILQDSMMICSEVYGERVDEVDIYWLNLLKKVYTTGVIFAPLSNELIEPDLFPQYIEKQVEFYSKIPHDFVEELTKKIINNRPKS